MGGSSAAEAQISEADYLQMVLNNVEFTYTGMKLTLPDGMPMEHPLAIHATKGSTHDDGSFYSQDLIDSQNVYPEGGLRPKVGWDIDIDSWKEGDDVTIYLRFYEQEEGETTGWAASWVYEDGQMVRQPWMKETVGLPEQYGRT